ncbi:MAG: secretion system protein [Betaproteobacteria bacterium RIFCSPLOWO2_02_FULL_65_24]|nr:MAG: secretion system protein [Betaproteobacteria bacterium RIFCSPLOWO2_02_FULL_65_24]OGA76388.1 MAG: secretion system protein [Betaproteobacteria bacterium RIFCSPLOWO2_12_FULL_66_14]
MALFSYKAIDARGKAALGQIEAVNLIDLEMRLKRMGLDLVRGGPTRRGGALLRKGSIGRQDLINFCFHLEQLTNAGVPLVDSLADLRDSTENTRFREVISGVIESIQGGAGLSQALGDYPDVFSGVFCSLVRAGEATGRLSEVLKSLTESLKWEDELAAQTKKLIMYPAFVGSIVVLVTLFLMIYLVPQMVGFIKNMGQQIPFQTRLLIAVSRFFVDYWWAIIATPLIAGFGLKMASKTNPAVRYRMDRMKLNLPVVGNILRKIILSRFASTFALMYSAGITVLDAIRSSEETAGNVVVQEGLHLAGQEIADGKSVTNAFQDAGLFPPLVIRMLRVGETTGALDNALLNVSYFYNREVRESIGKIQVLIEPALTVFLGAILGWVMLSVLGPIYDVITKVKL